ncbi:uncharacterized protein B0H18DRAFT_906583, partial [Fomitopsis serialis]|uniref:uncharacterized protein n=1 Tax=Fomitopsis serialis TaxID=139415 RepID=UPI00200859DC
MNLLGFSLVLDSNHCGPYNQFAKCPQAFTIALLYPDRWFRHHFRMGRQTFERLVARLETCDIFQSRGRKPQRPVRYQLGCFLVRYGKRGTDALSTAHDMGIGFGSVHKYCERVMYALRELGLDWVKWGDRSVTKAWVHAQSRLRGCLGMLDGTLIQLTEPPRLSGSVFFCR